MTANWHETKQPPVEAAAAVIGSREPVTQLHNTTNERHPQYPLEIVTRYELECGLFRAGYHPGGVYDALDAQAADMAHCFLCNGDGMSYHPYTRYSHGRRQYVAIWECRNQACRNAFES